MKPLILLAFFFFLTSHLTAQTKTDTTRPQPPQSMQLNLDKLGASFQKDQSDLAEAEKQIEAWTAKRNQIIGRMQRVQEIATDSTYRITEAPKKK